MRPLKGLQDIVTRLPRGGYLVNSPIGYIQFGSPPETVKDTMLLPKKVPQIFVLPSSLFNWHKGISVGEIEFPIYYNFFLKDRKTYVICNAQQAKQIKVVLREAIYGPEKLDISKDYETLHKEHHVPDLKKECDYFKDNLQFSDFIEFVVFKNNKVDVKGITIKREKNGSFLVSQNNELIAEVPGVIEYKVTYKIGEKLKEPYNPSLFSVTCLGPSHGFDPDENTSGYIIWLDHLGIMVDPPVNSTEWLKDSNVSPKLIDSIILTHCHADHDAGTFQKILEEGKITIYSTETIMMSFMRKYSSLSGVSISYLMKLFNFHPIKIDQPLFIHSAKFKVFYTLHSIPTIGFKMEFQDQTFVYSSDHNNDPVLHKKLLDQGIINQERYQELNNFPWDSKVIYHESGIPPLHTPIKILNSLDKEIQKKTVVYHIAKKDFPEETYLTLATFGIENTLDFETEPPQNEKALKILSLLKHLDFFNNLPLIKAREFLAIVEEERYKKGEIIIKKNTKGDKFYIIYSGNVSVDSGFLEEKKIYSNFEYFGEVALVTEQTRGADVFAETDVLLYTIERDKFLNFIVGTGLKKTLLKLARTRTNETWNLLSRNNFFHHCTSSQKTFLESIFEPVKKTGQGFIISEGDIMDYIYIIREGEVNVSKNGVNKAILKKGDYIGALNKVYYGEKSVYSFYHKDTVSLFAMKRDDLIVFVDNNPGLLMKIVYSFGNSKESGG